MLGERRSNSLFAPAAPAEPERKPEQAEVHDISFEEHTGRSLFAEAATAPRASELFFAPQEKGVTFAEALSQVQGYLSETYATLITEDNSGAKEQMKRRMARYLQENRIAVDGMTASELVDALYTEMAEYGFLTKYIFADGIEEIDINSWRDIEIQYSDGHTAKLEEHFDSPEHAANVIRRMLQNSGKVLDNASPIITSRLAKNIRISVIKTPVLDEDAGVAASIRIVNPRNLSKADFVQSGTATEEMLDFLSACLRYGVSICVAGATSSGKTTVAGWLLSTIPDRKRIFTIEDGSRELQLIRERDGRVTNSVVHTQTRDSENERQRIHNTKRQRHGQIVKSSVIRGLQSHYKGFFIRGFQLVKQSSELTEGTILGTQMGYYCFKGHLYCLGSQRSTVRKFDTITQMEGVSLAVITDFPGFSQLALDLPVIIVAYQSVVKITTPESGTISAGYHRRDDRIEAYRKVPILGDSD